METRAFCPCTVLQENTVAFNVTNQITKKFLHKHQELTL